MPDVQYSLNRITSPAINDVGQDWALAQGALNHLAKSVQALVKAHEELQAENERLKKELEEAKKPPA